MQSPPESETNPARPTAGPAAAPAQIYAEPLTAAIDRLARRRFGRPWPSAAEPGEEAARLDVTYAPRRLDSLAAEDFPCIALGRNGAGAVLDGRQGDTILVGDATGTNATPMAQVAEGFSGIVFHIRRIERPA